MTIIWATDAVGSRGCLLHSQTRSKRRTPHQIAPLNYHQKNKDKKFRQLLLIAPSALIRLRCVRGRENRNEARCVPSWSFLPFSMFLLKIERAIFPKSSPNPVSAMYSKKKTRHCTCFSCSCSGSSSQVLYEQLTIVRAMGLRGFVGLLVGTLGCLS